MGGILPVPRLESGVSPLDLMPALQPLVATGVAAMGLLLILLPGRGSLRWVGAFVGLMGIAWLFVLAGQLPDGTGAGALARQAAFIVFAVLSLSGAVQMISQKRPVYAALFFVLVVLSTCGLLLLLEAWFMAFAVVIVYAGAILVTYMFVLMLAHQASDADSVGEIPAYDRRSRDPVAGVVVAALLAASITCVSLIGIPALPPAATEQAQLQASVELLKQLPRRLDRALAKADFIAGGDVTLFVKKDDTVVAQSGGREVVIASKDLPDSTSHVGWDLVARFPASLEVAGVILLMAMFGAVVLARRQIDLGEDELRASAGLAPLAPDDIEDPDA